jgi:hypothetical protein
MTSGFEMVRGLWPRSAEWLLAGLFLLTVPLVNTFIRGDGNEYYAYIASVVMDGDLDFENEYRRGDPAFQRAVFDAEGRVMPVVEEVRAQLKMEQAASGAGVRGPLGQGEGQLGRMPNGSLRNVAAVGPSVLWTPFFLTAHGLVRLLNSLGSNVVADGYSLPYRWLCAVGTALYAFLGVLLAFRVAERLTDRRTAMAAAIGIWFASSLPVYVYFLPFHVPALSSFTVAFFLWYWVKTRAGRDATTWALWGAIGGLMVETYYLTGILLLIALLEYGRECVVRWREGSLSLWRQFLYGVCFSLGVLVAMVPNFVIKGVLYGSPLTTGYLLSFFWTELRLLEVAFSPEHGMFLWTPVLLPAVIGLALLWRRDRWLTGNLLLVFVAFYVVISAHRSWHGHSSFGNRFFVSFTPVFILGLAVFLEKSRSFLARHFPARAQASWLSVLHPRSSILSMALGVLILWNIGFMFQWGVNLVPNRGPVDFAVVARNQVTVVPKRIAGFVVRYLGAREQVTREVGQDDLKEVEKFQLRR